MGIDRNNGSRRSAAMHRDSKKKKKYKNPLVIQSNCGVQFTSAKYAEITDKMIMSYSHKGTPWDNTCIESFHALIKREWLNFYKIENYKIIL